MKQTQLFFIGTYNKKGIFFPKACGEGIVSCMLNTESGQIHKIGRADKIVNPTYLTNSSKKDILFAASDHYNNPGKVKAFMIDQQGNLDLLSSEDAKGKFTCHITTDRKGKRIFVVSYMNGLLTEHKFEENKIFSASKVISYKGMGPNNERQEQAHPHQASISPCEKWLCVCDLGSDKIWIHDLNKMTDNLDQIKHIDLPPGYGPRHLLWNLHLPICYVFCELNSKILTYRWGGESGDMILKAEIETLPEDYDDIPSGAAIRIHPSNKTLYVSNRGHDSIAVFSINQVDGKLKFVSLFSTNGAGPRDFNVDPSGKWLLAANQDTNTILPFELDPQSGKPTGKASTKFKCGTPVCVHFIDGKI